MGFVLLQDMDLHLMRKSSIQDLEAWFSFQEEIYSESTT